MKSPDIIVLNDDAGDRMLTQTFKMLHIDNQDLDFSADFSEEGKKDDPVPHEVPVLIPPPRKPNRQSVQFSDKEEVINATDETKAEETKKNEDLEVTKNQISTGNDNKSIPEDEKKPEEIVKKKQEDKTDKCDLFGDLSNDNPDVDAPPPTLWWDDLGMIYDTFFIDSSSRFFCFKKFYDNDLLIIFVYNIWRPI